MPFPFDDDSIADRIERLLEHVADNLTDRDPRKWPGWIVRLYGKIDGVVAGQSALLQEFNQLRSTVMAVNDSLTTILSDLNSSLAVLAQDKSAASAEVNALHQQVTDLQSQLTAAQGNVVDPALVDQIASATASLRDKINNFNVPDPVADPGTPVTTDPGTGTDPGTPVSTDPGTGTTDPGTPVTTDPGTPVSTDPGTPATTDPATGTDPSAPVTTDPSAPVTTDPSAPVTTDPSTPVPGSGVQ